MYYVKQLYTPFVFFWDIEVHQYAPSVSKYACLVLQILIWYFSEGKTEFFEDSECNIDEEVIKTPIATFNFKFFLYIQKFLYFDIFSISCNSPNQTHEFKNNILIILCGPKNSLKENKGRPWIELGEWKEFISENNFTIQKPKVMKLSDTKATSSHKWKFNPYSNGASDWIRLNREDIFRQTEELNSGSKRKKRQYSNSYKRDNFRKKSSIEILKELFRRLTSK